MFSHPEEASAQESAAKAHTLAETHPANEVAIFSPHRSEAALGLSILSAIFAERVHVLCERGEDAEQSVNQATKVARSHVVRSRGIAQEIESGLQSALEGASIVFVIEPDEALLAEVSERAREDALIFVDPGERTLESFRSGQGADAKPRLERVIGLRLFGSPHRVQGAEMLRSAEIERDRLELSKAVLTARFGLFPVEVRDQPLGLARRIETMLLNEAAKLVEAYPALWIERALAGETGRPMGALSLLDRVGWEHHRRRANLLSEESGDARLRAPSYMSATGRVHQFFIDGEERLVLDLPSGRHAPIGSFDTEPLAIYEAMRDLVHLGRYAEALEAVMNADGDLPKLTRELLATHLVDALRAVGSEIDSVASLDRLVGSALGWLPPGALVDLIGAQRARALIAEAGLGTVSTLEELGDGERLYRDARLSPGAFFNAQ